MNSQPDLTPQKETKYTVPILFLFLILNAFKITFVYYIFNIDQNYLPYHYVASLLIDCIIFYLTLRFSKAYFFIIAYLIQFAYLTINLSYFIYFDSFIHVNYYYYLFQEYFELAENFSMPINPKILNLLIDLPCVICILILYHTVHKSINRLNVYRKKIFIYVISTLFMIYAMIYAVHYSSTKYPLNDFTVVEDYGMLAHNVVDLLKTRTPLEEVAQISYARKFALSYGKKISKKGTGSNRANIIMLQVESLDANIIDATYKGEYVTPFLHWLSTKSIFYPYTLSYHTAGGSSDCDISVINSIEPLHDFPTMGLSNYSYPNSMVKQLSKQSYGVFAFHGNTGSFYKRSKNFKHMGFDMFYDISEMGLKEEGWGASDKDVFTYVLNELQSAKKPFFYYVITMSSHEPFKNVTRYYHNVLFDEVRPALTRDYFNSMSYVDTVLKDFVSAVRNTSKNAYIFIYGDHTPYLINKGSYKRAFAEIEDNGFEFVPLFIVTPDEKVFYEKSKVASFLDLAPTVLFVTGLSFKIRSDGINLLETPITDAEIPYKGTLYSRELLFNFASSVRKNNGGAH